MAFNIEKEKERKSLIILLYRRFIRLGNTIEKIRVESGELNDEDIEAIAPYYPELYRRGRKGNGN